MILLIEIFNCFKSYKAHLGQALWMSISHFAKSRELNELKHIADVENIWTNPQNPTSHNRSYESGTELGTFLEILSNFLPI